MISFDFSGKSKLNSNPMEYTFEDGTRIIIPVKIGSSGVKIL
jgi:hypothetical protein